RSRAARCVRRRGRVAVRLLHTRADRERVRAAGAHAAADVRGDQRGDGRKPVPVRCLSEDRAGDPARRGSTSMTVRFVKAQREMEGRYEDVWVLVDEADDLETWNDEAELDIVGSPGTRLDGHARASGRARYTVDIRPPGTLETAVLRSPVAHARVSGIDLEAARALPGVRAVLGPGSELGL